MVVGNATIWVEECLNDGLIQLAGLRVTALDQQHAKVLHVEALGNESHQRLDDADDDSDDDDNDYDDR